MINIIQNEKDQENVGLSSDSQTERSANEVFLLIKNEPAEGVVDKQRETRVINRGMKLQGKPSIQISEAIHGVRDEDGKLLFRRDEGKGIYYKKNNGQLSKIHIPEEYESRLRRAILDGLATYDIARGMDCGLFLCYLTQQVHYTISSHLEYGDSDALRPGDAVYFSQHEKTVGDDTYLCTFKDDVLNAKSAYHENTVHFALYIGNGLFISKLGNPKGDNKSNHTSNPITVQTRDDIRQTYPNSTNCYKIEPLDDEAYSFNNFTRQQEDLFSVFGGLGQGDFDTRMNIKDIENRQDKKKLNEKDKAILKEFEEMRINEDWDWNLVSIESFLEKLTSLGDHLKDFSDVGMSEFLKEFLYIAQSYLESKDNFGVAHLLAILQEALSKLNISMTPFLHTSLFDHITNVYAMGDFGEVGVNSGVSLLHELETLLGPSSSLERVTLLKKIYNEMYQLYDYDQRQNEYRNFFNEHMNNFRLKWNDYDGVI